MTMKPVNVKRSTYINSNKERNYQDPKLKIGDIVRISIYKKKIAKVYLPNWSGEIFVIKKFKNTVLWAYVIKDLKGKKELLECFTKRNCKKTNQKVFRVEKVRKRKDGNLYVK